MAEKPKKAAKAAAKPKAAAAKKPPPAKEAVTGRRGFLHDKPALQRVEAGAAQDFKRRQENNPDLRKPPKTYKYDSSLAPELQWCENAARGEGEKALAELQKLAQTAAKASDGETAQKIRAAAAKLQTLGAPFLDWAGKTERGNFTVPSLPLYTHERLSVEAILDTLQGHKRNRTRRLGLFGEGEASVAEKINGAYTHKNGWQNRLILGDSLLVMNSLLEYEGMGGSVQMVYMDPPYGIRFGGNFQPFVRQKNVKEDDSGLTREPEMVKAFRDTWELGVHSWLTYMRDRLLVARDLLIASGSCFVQISDKNVHFVRNVMDEVFGKENFVTMIPYKTNSGVERKNAPRRTCDYIVWYAKDKDAMKFNRLFVENEVDTKVYRMVEDRRKNKDDKNFRRPMTPEERANIGNLPNYLRPFRTLPLHSANAGNNEPRMFNGKKWRIPNNSHWRHTDDGFKRLVEENRIMEERTVISSIRYFDDFAFKEQSENWDDTGPELSGIYVVQTSPKPIQRCMLMTTEPGDLVFDPTCGSGTTAVVAEQWGRRWITADVSRVPLALARERLLTTTYTFYQLKGKFPSSGFVYKCRQNKKGEEVGGIVPHVTLGSIANNEPTKEEVLVDKPEKTNNEARVSGPFCFEAIMPPALKISIDGEGSKKSAEEDEDARRHIYRMTELLRLTPEIQISNGDALPLRNLRRPARALSVHAEATTTQDDKEKRVAITFGPENGPISDLAVREACKEASNKDYDMLLVVAFAITPDARQTLSQKNESLALPTFYSEASNDTTLKGLLKQTRASKSFAFCGLPDVSLKKANKKGPNGEQLWEAKLLALDLLNPIDMKNEKTPAEEVPCWMLDPDYDAQCFRAGQVFFPRTKAWNDISKDLRTEFNDTVREHLSGDTSAPFAAGEQIAVKVIDKRGNELLVVLPAKETKK